MDDNTVTSLPSEERVAATDVATIAVVVGEGLEEVLPALEWPQLSTVDKLWTQYQDILQAWNLHRRIK